MIAEYLVGDVVPALIKFINDIKGIEFETKKTKQLIDVTTNLDIEDKSIEFNLRYKIKLK